MASFPLASTDRLSISRGKCNLYLGIFELLDRNRTSSCSLPKNCFTAVSKPSLSLNYTCRSHHRFKQIRSLAIENRNIDTHPVEEDSNNNETHSVKGENNGIRKFFSRLLQLIRLLPKRLQRIISEFNLNGALKNVKQLTLSLYASLVLGFCFLFFNLIAKPVPKVVPYSDLITSLQSGDVTKVLFEEGTRRIYYNRNPSKDSQTLDDKDTPHAESGKGEMRKSKTWEFCTRKVDHDESYLLSLMREKGTSYGAAPQSVLNSMGNALMMMITLWIPLTPLLWFLQRSLPSKSPAKKREPTDQLVNFDDVDGVDAAKVELMEIVGCLRGSINYNKLGAKLPRGVLLVGPPGTGKTLLARAVAGEAGVPFFSVSASEFVELFVGRGAARVRDLFSYARKNAPSIIFIDELDAVGQKRGFGFSEERDQTLNQLLTEMDGFESDINVVVIAATNRPEVLDPALCRPGRFSRKVYVGEPDEDGRRKILAIHLRGVPLEEDKDLVCNLVASLTQGLVGADLANIVNEAALLSARRGADCVAREDIMEAIERAKFGVNERRTGTDFGKLFTWIPSLMGKNDIGRDRTQGPLADWALRS